MLEGLFGGLDKMYRLHKWLGIIALSGSILHWTSKQFPKWLVKLGLFDGKKPPRPPMQEVLTLKDWLVTQRHFAEEVGEIAFLRCSRLIGYRTDPTYSLPLVCQTSHLNCPSLSLHLYGTPLYWQTLLTGLSHLAGCWLPPYSSVVFVRSPPSLNALVNRKRQQ